MEPFHKLIVPGEEPVTRRGEPKPIQILTQRIQGHKVTTRLTGLETFLISPEVTAKDLTKICACSVSVSPVPGKTKDPLMELMVQGPQQNLISEYLVGKGVPKKHIEVLDKSKKK